MCQIGCRSHVGQNEAHDGRELDKDDLGYYKLPEPITISSNGKEYTATGVRMTFTGYGFKVQDEGLAEIVYHNDLETIQLLQEHLTIEQVEQIIGDR